MNESLPGLVAHLGAPGLSAAGTVAVCLAAALWVRGSRPSALSVSRTALAAALLASPITWMGHGLLLLPIFLSRRWSLPLGIAGGLLLVPWSLIWPLANASVVGAWAATFIGLGTIALPFLACLRATTPAPRLPLRPADQVRVHGPVVAGVEVDADLIGPAGQVVRAGHAVEL